MGKTSKWIKHFLIGKKDKDKEKSNNIGNNAQGDETLVINGLPTRTITVPPTLPGKEKRRWSFRRSSPTAPPSQLPEESETEHEKNSLAIVAAAEMELTDAASDKVNAIEESSAIKIQSFYRGYLSRKALNALRGLVKLQALVRGHLVRKQAAATLRCMQSLIRVQSRARAQRLHMVEESKSYNTQKPFNHRKLSHDFRSHSYQDLEIAMEENVKIVEMDPGNSRPKMRSSRTRHSSHGSGQMYPFEHIISTYKTSTKHDQEISPSPSARTENSVHVEDYSFNTSQSSPQNSSRTQTSHAESIYREYPQYYPSYMANTQSSKAKVRSQSAPKTRLEMYERQSSGRRIVPRGVKMQRSSSHVAGKQKYQYPWSVKLDKSSLSLKDSESGSNCTVFTVY